MLREKWLQYFPNDIITPHCQAGKNSPSKKSEKLPYYPRDLAHVLSKAQLTEAKLSSALAAGRPLNTGNFLQNQSG